MSFLGPILHIVLQNLNPNSFQFFTSPEFLKSIKGMMKIPTPLIAGAVNEAAELPAKTSKWYSELSPEDRKRLNDAITWAAKDVTSYAAAQLTGLPIDNIVGDAVEAVIVKVLGELDHRNPSFEEVQYIKGNLLGKELLGVPATEAMKLLV